jgi:hypothetical protein
MSMATIRNVDPATGEILDPLAGLESDNLDAPADMVGEARAALFEESQQQQVWREVCPRCNGTGAHWMNSMGDTKCFGCGGEGFKEYKTSPEQRAKRANPSAEGKQRYREKLQREAARRWAAFVLAKETEAAWIVAAADRGFDFAASMRQAVEKYGKLTEGQLNAVQRCMQRDHERAERIARERTEAAQRSEPVNPVNLHAVEEAFARAKSQGIKWPKLTLDGFQLSPAGENSRNAGAIYVTQGSRDGAYLGKVLRGSFQPSRECADDIKEAVLQAMADPMASAVAYGKKFGRCAVCHRELSDPESIERGIGPICAERMGW